MRQRRAERLVLRADIALDAGFPEDAATCLEEARRLAPALPAVRDLEQKLNTWSVEPTAAAGVSTGTLGEETVPAVDFTPASAHGIYRRVALIVAAAAILLAAGVATRMRTEHIVEPQRDVPAVIARANAAAPPADAIHRDTAAPPLASPPADPIYRDTPAPPLGSTLTPPSIARAESAAPPEALRTPRTEPRSESRNEPAPARRTALAPMVPSAPVAAGTTGTRPPLVRPEADARGTSPTFTNPVSVPTLRVTDTSDAARLVRAPFAATPIGGLPEPVPATALAAPTVNDSTAAALPQESLVRNALGRYADAYSRLDAAAAQRVWPRVDRAALSRAFDTLASQRVSLGDCAVDVLGTTARATCSGSATWAPKVGSGSTRTDARRWSFDLAKSGESWQIVNARVQNK